MTYIGKGINEYGTPISIFLCVDCALPFTTCPEVKTEAKRWEWADGGCLRPQCRSYDPARDVELWGFGDAAGLVEAQLRGNPKALAWKGRERVEIQREPAVVTQARDHLATVPEGEPDAADETFTQLNSETATPEGQEAS